MRILVTGSSGFIGKYLVGALEQNKHQVTSFDIANGNNVLDQEELFTLKPFDVIIHLANKIFVPESYEDPVGFYKLNFLSTLNLLELSRINQTKFIYLSSYVYGNPEYLPVDENHPVKAHNPYAHSKIIAEQLCKSYHYDFNVPITVFRPFNIYGAGQHPNLLFSTLFNQAVNGIITVKDERPKRDYVHVKDVVNAILLSVQSTNKKLNIYNIGTGTTYSVKEVVEKIQSLSDTIIDYSCTNEYRPNEVMDTPADIANIKKDLNWAPTITLDDGLKQLYLDYLSK